jgi:hypothetical protein|tara:strand:- start:719 stop:949 length:231 start_codon:yes stop_codon:yes gene_type:complete
MTILHLICIEINDSGDGLAESIYRYNEGTSPHMSDLPYWLVKKEAYRVADRYTVPIFDYIVMSAGTPLYESLAKMK